MKKITIILLLIVVRLNSLGQVDSTWNLMLLKKGMQLEIQENMSEYNSTGFYLYRNCFYDLKLKNNTRHTLRLVDIKFDTLVFIGISPKLDTDLSAKSKDTTWLDYKSISDILLLKSGMGKANKKIKCEDFHFIFYKSTEKNTLESKYAYVFSSRNEMNELVPRLSHHGLVYYFEYGGTLYYHSGINVMPPKYSDDEKVKALNAVMTALDLIVNQRLNITIHYDKPKPNEQNTAGNIMYKTLGFKWFYHVFGPASAFVTADRDEARNPQRIHVFVATNCMKNQTCQTPTRLLSL